MIDDETANEKCKNEEINLNNDNCSDNKNELKQQQQSNFDDNLNNNFASLQQQQQNVHQISQFQHQQHNQQLHHQRQQINSPIENRFIIDKDGLTMALKCFTSSTLTMRLSGIAQINNYISLFNEYLQTDNQLANLRTNEEGKDFVNWILDNKIIEHIFGPNLHVEVIKQSQIILNFVVSHLNSQHIDVIWSASQLKHCSKQVFDILMPLIKNMNIPAVLHLYNLLKNLDIKEHTEQTLCLASNLLKFIWTKSFNINEPLNLKHQDDGQTVLMKKNIVSIFGSNPNFDYFKEASDDSSASASMVDTDEEEVSTFLSKDHQYVNKSSANVDQTGGDSMSSCDASSSQISLDEENNKQDDNLTNEVFSNKTRANSTKLKSHRPIFSQSNQQPDYSSNLQTPQQQSGIQEEQESQKLFDTTHHSELTAEYLEKKNFNLNNNSSDSDLECECESSDYKKDLLRKEHKQQISEDNKIDFECFKKQSHHLKLNPTIDEDDEDMYESDVDEGGNARYLTNLLKLKKDKNLQCKNQPALSDSSSSPFSVKNMADFDGEESDAESATSDQLDLNAETDKVDSLLKQQRSHFRTAMRQQSYVEINMSTPNLLSINKKNYQTQHHSLINLANLQQNQFNENSNSFENEITAELIRFSLENVCKPGQTLLWDLLSDDSIRYLSDGLAQNCEKTLYNLICWLSDKRLRMKFIEGCMENISQNKSVIISLRLLPKLLMSFDQQRGKSSSEIHALTMMVESERNLLKNFFLNLVQYTDKYKHYSRLKNDEIDCSSSANIDQSLFEQPHKIRKTNELSDKSNSPSVNNNVLNSAQSQAETASNQNNSSFQTFYDQSSHEFFTSMLYSHLEEIQTRLHFLSIIFSSTCSPEQFKLSKEQIDILWYCLAYDLECRDELFNWLLNQARTKGKCA